MRIRDIIGLTIAIIVALAAAYYSQKLLQKDTSKSLTIKKVEPKLEKILVATRDLKTGDRLKNSDVKFQEWPAEALNSSFINEKTFKPTDTQDAFVSKPVTKGEPITTGDIIKPGDRGFLAAIIAPGKRAISVDVNAATASSGLITPGDYVDVLFFQKDTRDKQAPEPDSETLVSNVRVLAIDSFLNAQTDKKVIPKTVTLEVTPDQAETILAAVQEGAISLSLRSMEKGPVEKAPAPKPAKKPDHRTITIIRGKDRANVTIQEK